MEKIIQDVFNFDPASLLVVFLRTLAVYLALWALLRVGGKRQLGQMESFDLVVILVISNAVQNAMVGPDTSLTAGLLAAGTLVLVNWIADRLLLRFPSLRQRVVGNPTLLVHDGKLLLEHLRREGLTEEIVLQALREHGVDHLDETKNAVLEVDGTISVTPMDTPRRRTLRRIRGRKPAG